MKRFLIETSVENAEGSQTWYVDATSEDEALKKYEQGGCDLYASNVDVTSLGEPEISGETTLDDFGDFTEQPAHQQEPDENRCPECGYLTKHTEHIGCLREQLNAINAFEQRNFAIVNMDKAPQPVVQAWSEGYRAGVADERTSEANIGIAGMGMKVEPARNNPYLTFPQPAHQQKMTRQQAAQLINEMADRPSPRIVDCHATGACVQSGLRAEQPVQRPWVGLTHDEYDAICDKHSAMSDFDFLADIEAKLKEKNT